MSKTVWRKLLPIEEKDTQRFWTLRLRGWERTLVSFGLSPSTAIISSRSGRVRDDPTRRDISTSTDWPWPTRVDKNGECQKTNTVCYFVSFNFYFLVSYRRVTLIFRLPLRFSVPSRGWSIRTGGTDKSRASLSRPSSSTSFFRFWSSFSIYQISLERFWRSTSDYCCLWVRLCLTTMGHVLGALSNHYCLNLLISHSNCSTGDSISYGFSSSYMKYQRTSST